MARPDDFGVGINMDFFKEVLTGDIDTVFSDYYLTSSLDYEAARCNLFGKSFIYYIIAAIKGFFKKMGNMLIYNIPLIGTWIIMIIISSFIFLPIIMLVWKAISKFMCFLKNVGLPSVNIKIPWPINKNIQLFGGWYPFKTMIFLFFGDVFDCGDDVNWSNKENGSCDDRFGGEGSGCNGSYATDYSLFKESDDTLCTNSLDCPDAPENYIMSDSMVSRFSPTIDKVNLKGTAPFKYLKCCENSGQSCSPELIKGAKESINYADKFPRGYSGEPDLDKREFIDQFFNPKDFSNFRPITMFEATARYFKQNKVWYSSNIKQIGSSVIPHTCTISTANPIYHWLDVYVLELREYIKYLIWGSLLIFIIYEIYNLIFHISEGTSFKNNCKKGGKCDIGGHVRLYLCKKEKCDKKIIDSAVKSFIEKYKGPGVIPTAVAAPTDAPTDAPAATAPAAAAIVVNAIPSELDDKQTIIFGFIMVISFIVLGIVSITTILKKKNKKNKVEITNWPI